MTPSDDDSGLVVELCEPFAQAFRGRASFRGSTRPEARAWLLTIARRQIAGYLRRGSLDRRALRRLAIQTPALDPGQTEGFVALYRREAEFVLMFCTRRVLDAETALDLTAETFAQAFRGRASFRGSTRPEARAWLLTIARRQIAGYLRRGSLDRRALRRLAIQTPALDPGQTEEIERRAGAAAIRAELAEQLARLNDDQRAALRLRVVEQRPYEEVARSLGITEATARARVSRGLRALATSLEPRPLTAQEEPWTSH